MYVFRRAEENEVVPIPESAVERIAVFRRDYVVRRYPLSDPQFALLQKLQSGATISEAIAAAADQIDRDDNSFAALLQSWFRFWSVKDSFPQSPFNDTDPSADQSFFAGKTSVVVYNNHSS